MQENVTGEQSASYQFALAAAELAYNTRCEDVVLLDLRGRSPATEFFVVATGTSPRQMRTVVEEVRDLGKKMGFGAWRTSGFESGRWILVDCVNLVCHVFDVDSRDFYDLELLWGDCPRIDWRKELGLPPVSEETARMRREMKDEEGAELMEEDLEEEGDESAVEVELADEGEGADGTGVERVEISLRKNGAPNFPDRVEGPEDETEEERAMHVAAVEGDSAEDVEEEEGKRPTKRGTAVKKKAKKAVAKKKKVAAKKKPAAKKKVVAKKKAAKKAVKKSPKKKKK